jgi:hypothetical protein
MKCSWILTGVAAFAVAMASGSEAHAKGGIVATMGNTQQTGDPMFQYSFDVELLPGSLLASGGFITIYDIPFLPNPPAQPPLTSQPSLSWGSATDFLGKTPIGFVGNDDPTVYNVTWQWNGAPIMNNSATNDLDLGIFTIGTTIELSSPPSVTLVYVGSLDGVNESNQGIVVVNAVPEPSSVILLLAGVTTLPVLCLRERRRRRLGRQAG